MRARIVATIALMTLVAPLSVVAQSSSASDAKSASTDADLDTLMSPTATEPAPAAAKDPTAAAPEPTPQSIPVQSLPPASETDKKPRRSTSLIEEIVVTAQKREESVNEVPIAISAFSGAQLKALGISDTRDLSKLVPGFSYSESGLNNPVYTLRGIGFNDASRTANSTVGVYSDEVNLPYSYMTKGASLDVQRIEVLKGPQGILYGRNTTGGAVNYIANKPQEELGYGLSGSYARFGVSDVEGFVTGALSDTLTARVAGRVVVSSKGWQYSIERPDDHLGQQEKYSARVLLDYKPVDGFRSNLSFDGWRDASEPQAPQAYGFHPQSPLGNAALNPRVANHPSVPMDSDDQQVADWSPDLPWKLDDTFWAIASRNYWDVNDNLSVALIASVLDFKTGLAFIPQSGLSVLNSEKSQATHTPTTSLELRTAGKLLDDKVSVLLGGYLSRDKVTDFQRQYFNTISALFNVVDDVYPVASSAILRGAQTASGQAVFLNGDWQIIEPLKLSLGTRYTQERRKYAGCTQDDPQSLGPPGGLAALFNGVSVTRGGTGGAMQGDCVTLDATTQNPGEVRGKLDEGNLSYRGSLSFKPGETQLYFLSYSRGFKSGGFPILGASDSSQYNPVTQEQLDSIELGGKTQWFDNLFTFNFALFHYDYKDKQLLSNFRDPVFGLLPKLFNAPKARVNGVEVEMQAEPLEGLFLSVAGSYLDTKIIEFSGLNFSGDQQDFAGNRLSFAPGFSAVMAADYQVPVGEALKLSTGLDVSYTGKTASDLEANPLFKIPSYTLLNLRVGLSQTEGPWKAGLWVRNVTNEFYLLSTPQLSADTIVRYTGAPRTYGVTASYNF